MNAAGSQRTQRDASRSVVPSVSGMSMARVLAGL
jgi:hypothetical protein